MKLERAVAGMIGAYFVGWLTAYLALTIIRASQGAL